MGSYIAMGTRPSNLGSSIARPLKNRRAVTPVVFGEQAEPTYDPGEFARLRDAAKNIDIPRASSGVKTYDIRSRNKALHGDKKLFIGQLSVEGHPMLALAKSAIAAAYNHRAVPSDLTVPNQFLNAEDDRHTSRMHDFGRFVGRVAEIHWGGPFQTIDTKVATSSDESFKAMKFDVKSFQHDNAVLVIDRFCHESYAQVEDVLLDTDYPIIRLQPTEA